MYHNRSFLSSFKYNNTQKTDKSAQTYSPPILSGLEVYLSLDNPKPKKVLRNLRVDSFLKNVIITVMQLFLLQNKA